MLSNIVPEVQLDCMQRLVHSLCNAGRVELLCALPFSATLLVRPLFPPSRGAPQLVALPPILLLCCF